MSNTYCPFIRETCKGNECVLFRNEGCVIVTLLGGLREKEEEGAPLYEADTDRTVAVLDRRERDAPDWIKGTTPEELAAEMLEFMRREFPDDQLVAFDTASRFYWESKGIQDFLMPFNVQMKMRKAEYLAEREADKEADAGMKKRLQEEKDELPSLLSQCIEWTRANGLRRLTLADVDTFILEKDLTLMSKTRRALYSMANLRLKSRA